MSPAHKAPLVAGLAMLCYPCTSPRTTPPFLLIISRDRETIVSPMELRVENRRHFRDEQSENHELTMKKFIRKLCSLRFSSLILATIFQVGMTQQSEEIEDLEKPAPSRYVQASLNVELRELVEID